MMKNIFKNAIEIKRSPKSREKVNVVRTFIKIKCQDKKL